MVLGRAEQRVGLTRGLDRGYRRLYWETGVIGHKTWAYPPTPADGVVLDDCFGGAAVPVLSRVE